MAVSASALGAHVIRALADMLLQGPLRKAGTELRADAEKLRRELKEELLYSEDAEKKVLEDDRARRWLAELRQVLYRADDRLLQAYGRAGDAQDQRTLALPILRRFTTDRYIKQEIRNLLADIGSVSKNRPPTLTRRNMENYQHDRSCDGQELIGHDNLVDAEKIEMRILPLVDKLTEHHEPSRQFTIFAIYGLGGVGKTTIARKIFDDQRTQSAFSTRVWVSISKGSSVAQILQATCAALDVPRTKNKLQMLLADKIGGRRIFLFFNIYNGVPSKQGIGNAEIFGNLIEVLKFFHAAAEGSRVLITTSDENVGNEIKSAQIQRGAEGYGLQTDRIWQLTVEDSWMLLLRAACLEQAKITPELKTIGIEILQKCNCLPLAIEAVGGVLRRKGYRQKEWEGVRDSSTFSLKDPTTGTEGGVRSSIYLSYQYAPPHLKQCFLYLSLFPVDFEIEQHLVTQLWISEGLIDIDTRNCHSLEETSDEQNSVSQQESNKHNNSEETAQKRSSASSEIVPVHDENNVSSEHARENTTSSSQGIVEGHNRQPPKGSPCISSSGHSSKTSIDNKQSHCSVQEMADSYFNELAERGLVQRENKTKGYKMHEQVRKIAESLTENEVCAGDPKYVATLPASLHRLSFLNKGLTTIPEDVGRLKSLKTLLLSGNPLGETDMDTICKNLELLRVLDLSDTEIQSVPKTLGNLVYLRHLDLSRTRIRALHESISRLRRLRFLGLRECEHLASLPKSIQKLLKLEYLDFRDSGITKSTRLHNLSHLALLHGFVVDSMSSNGLLLEDLQNMSNLSDLQIDIRKIVDGNIASNGNGMLKEKGNLRNLDIRCCTVNSENLSADTVRLKTMFTQLHPPQCLVSLKIDGYHGTDYPEWLSGLPNLQHLSLENSKFCERLPPIWHLQKLRFLRIANISKVQTIDMQQIAEMPSFPNLEEMEIEGMEDLEYWSNFRAGDLLHLRKLALRRCPKLKCLPGGLEHCKTMSKMELRDAGLVQVLEKIHVQELLVEALPSLAEVSNLPLMKVFTMIRCSNLGILSGVNSLQHIHMEDEHLEQLPKWLGQHFPRIETLDIVGKEQLLARCERSKEDWYIVREIPRVYAYLPNRLPYFSYARGNDFFCKYKIQRTDTLKDHLPSPEAGVQRTGSTASSSTTANNDSPLGPAAPVDETDRKFLSLGPRPADETYKKMLSAVSLFAAIVLSMIMNLTDSHRSLLEDFSLFGFYVCMMFFYIYFSFLVMKRRQ